VELLMMEKPDSRCEWPELSGFSHPCQSENIEENRG